MVDPTARLEERWEETALAQLGDAQLDVAGLGREGPLPAAVAMGGALVRTLVAAGADRLGRLEIDQLLEHEGDPTPDEIQALAGPDRIQQLGQGRLWQGHR